MKKPVDPVRKMPDHNASVHRDDIKSRDIRLDIIRSLSMLYIVFVWHFCDYVTLMNSAVLTIITKCVLTSFFFISGYLFGMNSKFQTGKDILSFYKKRLLRIIPLFAFAIVLFFLCGLISFAEAIKTLLGISAFCLPHTKTLWFMNVIIIYYLITPILMYKNRKDFFVVIAGLFCLSFFLMFAAKVKIDIRILLYFPAYCIGLFWHHFQTELFISKSKVRYCISLVSLLLFSAMYVYLLNAGYHTYTKISLPLLLIIAFEAITWNVFFIQGCTLFSKHTKIFLFLSYSSFAIYLFHRPFFHLVGSFLNIAHIKSDSWISIATFYISIPFLVFASWLIQKTFDFISKGRDYPTTLRNAFNKNV